MTAFPSTLIRPAIRAGWHPRSEREQTPMTTGTVKWFNATKGYGFIQPEDGSKDIFLHISEVQKAGLRDVREGERLEFEVLSGRDGKASAGNIRKA